MATSLNVDLLGNYQRVLGFETYLRTVKGANADPWDYQNYQNLIKNCLQTLEPITQKTLALIILKQAHTLQKNPCFYWGDKVVQYRAQTINEADVLISNFKEACNQRTLDKMNKFSKSWITFITELDKDYKMTKEYYASLD